MTNPTTPASASVQSEQALRVAARRVLDAFGTSDESLEDLYEALSQPAASQEAVGEAGTMPGTSGFTMACFKASDVPVGTKLYTHPQQPSATGGDGFFMLDDEGKAMIVNSHHYTVADIRALIEQLKAFADPLRTTQTDFDNLDWRGFCNVLWRVMMGLACDLPPASQPTSGAAGDGELPPLPEADGFIAMSPQGSVVVPPSEFGKRDGVYKVFTAEQMREYARAALATPPAQQADLDPLRVEITSAWNDLPDALRCHPGLKRLHRVLTKVPSAAPTAAGDEGKPSGINALGEAIDRALDEVPVSDVLTIITGIFVGLTVELVRRKGHDTSKPITVNGGQERDITIHAPKAKTGKVGG